MIDSNILPFPSLLLNGSRYLWSRGPSQALTWGSEEWILFRPHRHLLEVGETRLLHSGFILLLSHRSSSLLRSTVL